MSRKKIPKKSNILRLKLVLEEKRVANEETAAGSESLKSLLLLFSKKVSKEQKEHFDKHFIESSSEKQSKETDLSNTSLETSTANIDRDQSPDLTNPKRTVPKRQGWIRKLYKKIVMRSHPDKFVDFPVSEIKDKYTKIYIDAVNAFENNDVGVLFICASEVEIDISEYDSEKYISDSIKKCLSETAKIKNCVGYRWYHIEDENTRLLFLRNYLVGLGYIFNREKAEEFMKKSDIRKRKVGTRPKPLKRVKSKESK